MEDNKKLDRIRRLIQMASDEGGNPEERKIAQAQAEKLMIKYSVEEWEIAQAGGRQAAAAKPERKDGIFICGPGHPCAFALAQLAIGLGKHMNVSLVFNYLGIKSKTLKLDVTATAIGYPEDLRMWEMIFTMLHLQLMGKIDPKVDTTKDFDENVYTLHAAGLKWPEIAQRINSAVTPAGWFINWTKNGDGGRMKRAARRHAAKIGEEYISKASPTAYQRSFTDSFVATVLRRFAEAKAKESTSGTALVLRKKFDSVLEFQAEIFPELTHAKDPFSGKTSTEGWVNGAKAGREADLSINPKMAEPAAKALN